MDLSRRRPFVLGLFLAIPLALAFATVASCTNNDTPPSGSDASEAAPAQPEAAPPSEAGLVDAPACGPGPLNATPEWHPPRPMWQPACSDPAQVQGFLSACYESGQDSAVCSAFQQQNPTCYACVVSSTVDAQWGPIVDYGAPAILSLNTSGCYATYLNEGINGCGAAIGLLDDCTRLACISCKTDTQQGFDDFQACQQSDPVVGGNGTCASYIAQYDTKCALLSTDAGAANKANAMCDTSSLQFEDALAAYIRLWCTAPPDGGSDAGSDASSDGGDGG